MGVGQIRARGSHPGIIQHVASTSLFREQWPAGIAMNERLQKHTPGTAVDVPETFLYLGCINSGVREKMASAPEHYWRRLRRHSVPYGFRMPYKGTQPSPLISPSHGVRDSIKSATSGPCGDQRGFRMRTGRHDGQNMVRPTNCSLPSLPHAHNSQLIT